MEEDRLARATAAFDAGRAALGHRPVALAGAVLVAGTAFLGYLTAWISAVEELRAGWNRVLALFGGFLGAEVAAWLLILWLGDLFLAVHRSQALRPASALRRALRALPGVLTLYALALPPACALAGATLITGPCAAVLAPIVALTALTALVHVAYLVLDGGLGPLAAAGGVGVGRHGGAWLGIGASGFALLALSWITLLGASYLSPVLGSVLSLLAVLLLLPLCGVGLASAYEEDRHSAFAAEGAPAGAPDAEEALRLPARGPGGGPLLWGGALLLLLTGSGAPGVALLVAELAQDLRLPAGQTLPAIGASLAVPFLVGLALVVVDHGRRQTAVVDARGVLLDPSDRWPGTRLSWADIVAFRLTGQGVALQVRGQPWTRWRGPTLPCDDRLTHDVVARLEAAGVAQR